MPFSTYQAENLEASNKIIITRTADAVVPPVLEWTVGNVLPCFYEWCKHSAVPPSRRSYRFETRWHRGDVPKGGQGIQGVTILHDCSKVSLLSDIVSKSERAAPVTECRMLSLLLY